MAFTFEDVGYWSEVKLDILKKYAAAYSTIMSARRFHHVYIDAFAGAGKLVSRTTGEVIAGSPMIALEIKPDFKEYFFIDIVKEKADELKRLTSSRADVHILQGDCNEILLREVFPLVKYEKRWRALCLLDPYGLHLNWSVIKAASEMRSIEIFLNFPVADMNRNVLWASSSGVDPADVERMNSYWGDDSWKQSAYSKDMFGFDVKTNNEVMAESFRKRLKEKAGFAYVPRPLPMRNSKGAVIYYLFFASPHPVGGKIVNNIFRAFARKGIV